MAGYIDFSGQVAVVTGGARGIGAEICKMLHGLGARLAVLDVNKDGAESFAASLTAAGGAPARAYGVNVAKSAEVDACVEQIVKDMERIDVLINNAGLTRDNLLLRMKDDAWDLVLDVNLKGTFYMTRACARPMLRAHKGAIVNLASVVGLMGNPGQANYSAAKGGIIALTKTAAKEFASRNVRVNAVAPGFIATEMTAAMTPDQQKAMLSTVPLGRAGTPEDVAGVVTFLASERASYVTGQVLTICGGMLM